MLDLGPEVLIGFLRYSLSLHLKLKHWFILLTTCHHYFRLKVVEVEQWPVTRVMKTWWQILWRIEGSKLATAGICDSWSMYNKQNFCWKEPKLTIIDRQILTKILPSPPQIYVPPGYFPGLLHAKITNHDHCNRWHLTKFHVSDINYKVIPTGVR